MFKNLLNKNNKKKKGFTLIELIVVIAILGILAAVLTPVMLNIVSEQEAKVEQSQADGIKGIVMALLATGKEANVDANGVLQDTASGNQFGKASIAASYESGALPLDNFKVTITGSAADGTLKVVPEYKKGGGLGNAAA